MVVVVVTKLADDLSEEQESTSSEFPFVADDNERCLLVIFLFRTSLQGEGRRPQIAEIVFLLLYFTFTFSCSRAKLSVAQQGG